MATRVGDFLRHDPLKLRFTSSNTSNLGPKSVIKKSLNQSVADITQTGYYTNHPAQIVLYYEKLDVSIVELETKKSLKITWTGQHNKEEVRIFNLSNPSGWLTSLPTGHTSIPFAQDQYIQ